MATICGIEASAFSKQPTTSELGKIVAHWNSEQQAEFFLLLGEELRNCCGESRRVMTSFNRHGHAATAKAVELYDEPRDLEPFEHEFYSAVHAINMSHATMVGNAARQWGIGSIVYDAVVDLATRQQDADLTAALEAYQAVVDAGDEVLEVEMMDAAE